LSYEDHVTDETGNCVSWCPACGPTCPHGNNIKECGECAREVMNPYNHVADSEEKRACEILKGLVDPPPETEEVKVYQSIKSNTMLDIAIGGVTVRSCIDCGVLVVGGPTRCTRCAMHDLEVPSDDIERWRAAKQAMKKAARPFLNDKEWLRLSKSLRGLFSGYTDCDVCNGNGTVVVGGYHEPCVVCNGTGEAP